VAPAIQGISSKGKEKGCQIGVSRNDPEKVMA